MIKNRLGTNNVLARWITRKRNNWIILCLWVLVVFILNFVLPQANQEVDDTAGNFSTSMDSTLAESLIEQEFPNENGLPALVVWHKGSGFDLDDLRNIQSVYKQLYEEPLPKQVSIPPLHNLTEEVFMEQVSEDGSTLIMPIFFDYSADADQIKKSFSLMEEQSEVVIGANPFAVDLDSDNLSARATGPAGILVDATELFSAGDFSLTLVTFVLVLTVLLIIYRSPILAFIPLIGVCFAYTIISPILGWMSQMGWVTFDSQGISIMTVLLFGVGTDYCLFLISKFRLLLRSERGTLQALRKTLVDKSGAIFISALTTALALSFLLLADFGPIQRFAIPFVLAISIVAISSLTLVPALLGILGRTAFYPFIPRTPEMIEEIAKLKGRPVPKLRLRKTFSEKLNSFVVKRAKIVTIATTLILLIFAAFVVQMEFTFDTLASFPESMPSREGFTIIEQSFHAGQLAPLKILIHTRGESVNANENLNKLSYVKNVSDPVSGQKNSEVELINVELALNPYSNEAMDTIPEIRNELIASLSSAGIEDPDQNFWIAGQTALQYDVRATSNRDALILFPIILGVIAILLLFYFRSVAAMLYLSITVIVSYFSALGLGWIFIHYVLGAESVQGFIPLYVFIFLGTLGVDYNIFMKSSIWKKARQMPLNRAIKDAATETGPVINFAGIILAGTFSVLATLPIQILVHFGIITAIGVLIDTFIVRPFLVPAISAWLGPKAFWPGKFTPVQDLETDKD